MASQELPEAALQALARLFDEVLKEPESRKRFFQESKGALPSGLPAEVGELFNDLSYEELRVLARTYEAMQRGNMTYDVGGVKVSFL